MTTNTERCGRQDIPYLHILPGSIRSPAGLEWQILRKLPLIVLAGTLIPAAAYLFAELTAGSETDAKQLMSLAILSIALVVTMWTGAFTVAIACVVVWIMKGPAYIADGYPLIDSERPTMAVAVMNGARRRRPLS